MSSDHRLPSCCVPKVYQLHLAPSLTTFEFIGNLNIECTVNQSTTTITCHAHQLAFSDPSTVSIRQNDTTIECKAIDLDKEKQQVQFTFAAPIETGEWTLSVSKFIGCLNTELQGFYRSNYRDSAGQTRWMATTQFEATDARRAFPCFDEPALKAEFDVSFEVDNPYSVFSNMPCIEETALEGSKRRFVFARTPRMSTYLLAFIVGEFDYIGEIVNGNVLLRVYTEPGKAHLGKFALETSKKALGFFEDYFGLKYQLPKVDLFAIPDFAMGAMENWGLITYRDSRLLVDRSSTSLTNLIAKSRTICHELAHMWFGNLVTMEWWTQLWLNEGFARFMEHMAVDFIFPEWQVWKQFTHGVMGQAFDLDALTSSHPIEVPVQNPDEISEVFDAISYAKGASVIRMLHAHIGPDKFKTAIQHYLKALQYQNATSDQLWEHVSQFAGENENIPAFMHAWTKRVGFPLVTVDKTSPGVYSLSQQRFTIDNTESKDDNEPWQIPIALVSSTGEQQQLLLKDKTLTITLKDTSATWIKLNVGQTAFFRARYDQETLKALGDAVKSKQLDELDRTGLLNDVSACVFAGLADIDSLMNLMVQFVDEEDLLPLEAVSSILGSLRTLFAAEDEIAPRIDLLSEKLFSRHFDALGWTPRDGESTRDSTLRATALARLSRTKAVSDECVRLFRQMLADPSKNTIPADFRAIVYQTGARQATEEDAKRLRAVYEACNDASEVRTLLSALGRLPKDEEKKNLLQWGILEGNIRDSNWFLLLASFGRTPQGRQVAWDFLQKNWTYIKENTGPVLIGHDLYYSVSNFKDEAVAAQVSSFFDANPTPAAARRIATAVERIQNNALAFQSRDKLEQWLKSYFA